MISNFYNYRFSACGMWDPSYLTFLIQYRVSAITYSPAFKLKSEWLILHISSSFKPLGGNRNNGYIPVSFCGVILHEKHCLFLVKPRSKFLIEKLVVQLEVNCLSCSPNTHYFFIQKATGTYLEPPKSIPRPAATCIENPLQNYPFAFASSLQFLRRKSCRQSLFCC